MTDTLFDLSREQLQLRLVADGVRPVHVGPLWRLLHGSSSTDAMVLPPPLRRWLDQQGMSVTPPVLPVVDTSVSDDRQAVKYLLRLDDGQQIETVTMGYPGRFTACVSTQAGCAMGCIFCATGQMGFVRQLRPAEIVGQVRHVAAALASRGERVRNLVLMGMGEPLQNYDHVMRALAILSDRAGMNIGSSRITINTVGVVPGILRLAREGQPYHLGVSLHGATDEERTRLVPVGVRWPLADLKDACRTYAELTGRRIFFAWTLIAGVNDTPEHADRLTRWLDGVPAHVNLIRLNTTTGFAGRSSPEEAADRFRATVRAAGIPCTIRQRRGIDVDAGCGQLATDRLPRARPSTTAPSR